MRVRYAQRAKADLREIFSFISKDSPAAARRVCQEIREVAERAGHRPGDGIRNPKAPNLRSLLVSRYQYRVHYEIRGDEVWIVHIRHTARRPYEPEA